MNEEGKDVENNYKKYVHCSFCNGLILKNIEIGRMKGMVSFLTKCPHCNHKAGIIIGSEKE
ncbi:hypothetical protein KAJ41_02065 [Candidatus Parcubacteria bacterium]|nr:hypothetical protein [Candidatus Parcubacteria bacterium]